MLRVQICFRNIFNRKLIWYCEICDNLHAKEARLVLYLSLSNSEITIIALPFQTLLSEELHRSNTNETHTQTVEKGTEECTVYAWIFNGYK